MNGSRSLHLPRGFTLIEMLVVVLLIVLITAIVGPLAISEIGRTSMREAERQVEAAAMLARADAQRRGAVVQLLARPADDVRGIGVELVTIDLTGDSVHAGDGAGGAGSLEDGLGAGADSPASGKAAGETGGAAALRVERAGTGAVKEKSILILPVGVRIRSVLPVMHDANDVGSLDGPGSVGSGSAENDKSFGEREGEEETGALLPLCVFFPDGQIVVSSPRYLVSRSGRVVSIQINAWTGRVTATPVETKSGNDDSTKENETTPKDGKNAEPSAFVPEDGGGE